MAPTRELIEKTLRDLNDAENNSALSPEEKSAAVDDLSAPDVRGWANGNDRGSRENERAFEEFLFGTFPDYHRTFEQVLVDPPKAAWTWRITGTSEAAGLEIDVSGATVARFDDRGRIAEFWLFYDEPAETP